MKRKKYFKFIFLILTITAIFVAVFFIVRNNQKVTTKTTNTTTKIIKTKETKTTKPTTTIEPTWTEIESSYTSSTTSTPKNWGSKNTEVISFEGNEQSKKEAEAIKKIIEEYNK